MNIKEVAALKRDDNLYCVVATADLPAVEAFAKDRPRVGGFRS